MPLRSADPVGAFVQFRDHLNGVFHRTITPRPLVFIILDQNKSEALISFRDSGEVASASVGQDLHLEFSQLLKAVPDGGEYALRTIKYRYAIFRDDTLQSDPIFRFEYESPSMQPDFPYCRNHLHLHPDFDDGIVGISPSELHIPTGWVTIESVIRFLIAELAVAPLSASWREVLQESEEQFKRWTARDV